MIINTYHGTYSQWLEEVSPIREVQKLVKSIPRKYNTFITKEVFKNENYFFFDRSKTSGHCSACHKDFEIEKGMVKGQRIRHKVDIICPNCKSKVSCISDIHYLEKEGYKHNLESCKWSLKLEESDGYLIFRYIRHVKSFRTKDGEINSKEMYRTFWSQDKKFETSYQSDPFDKGYAWVPYKDPSFGFWNENTDYILPHTLYVFDKANLSHIIEKTWAKYSGLAEYFTSKLEKSKFLSKGWEMEKYLMHYIDMPYIEQLSKCGFFNLIDELFHYYYRKELVVKGQSTICKTLNIDKETFRYIREIKNLSFDDISLIKKFKSNTMRLPSNEEFTFIKQNSSNVDFCLDFMKYKTLHKLIRYLESFDNSIKLNDYKDYISSLEELEIAMSNFNLFPKDFYEAHDRRNNELLAKRDKISQKKKEEEEAMYQLLIQDKDLSPIEGYGYLAIFPKSLDELKEEGENLNHCVGSYASRVASGETSIIFIREKNDPHKSFYTMEYNNGTIVQVQGKHHREPEGDVMAFARKVAYDLQQTEHKKIAV